ncbi:MAG: hypothetical protein Q8N51_01420 [Gammaproteobacteria bacterium]|nr:hypothetical protein [Gammaproteobacteria bacterium]
MSHQRHYAVGTKDFLWNPCQCFGIHIEPTQAHIRDAKLRTQRAIQVIVGDLVCRQQQFTEATPGRVVLGGQAIAQFILGEMSRRGEQSAEQLAAHDPRRYERSSQVVSGGYNAGIGLRIA